MEIWRGAAIICGNNQEGRLSKQFSSMSENGGHQETSTYISQDRKCVNMKERGTNINNPGIILGYPDI